MNSFNPKLKSDKIENYKNFRKKFPGTVITFVHKPLTKNYYDSMPIVLGLRVIGSKIFGVNIKLVPLRDRIRLLDSMISLKYENEPRVAVNMLLRGKFSKIMAACFEIYEIKNIKSKIKILEDDNWVYFSLNQYNSFKNIQKSRIYTIVRKRIKDIKIPMKYILTAIKNSFKKK